MIGFSRILQEDVCEVHENQTSIFRCVLKSAVMLQRQVAIPYSGFYTPFTQLKINLSDTRGMEHDFCDFLMATFGGYIGPFSRHLVVTGLFGNRPSVLVEAAEWKSSLHGFNNSLLGTSPNHISHARTLTISNYGIENSENWKSSSDSSTKCSNINLKANGLVLEKRLDPDTTLKSQAFSCTLVFSLSGAKPPSCHKRCDQRGQATHFQQ